MAYRTCDQEIEHMKKIHQILYERIIQYINIIDNLKGDDPVKYYNYYIEMVNFFTQYGHDTSFCRDCAKLEIMGTKQLGNIRNKYCKF